MLSFKERRDLVTWAVQEVPKNREFLVFGDNLRECKLILMEVYILLRKETRESAGRITYLNKNEGLGYETADGVDHEFSVMPRRKYQERVPTPSFLFPSDHG